jgi:hypothetical protein
MSLLDALKLPPLRSTPSTPAPAASPGSDADAARLGRSIEASRGHARQTLQQVQAIGALLEKKIAAASGAQKQELLAKRAVLKKKSDQAVAAIEQADADAEAIADPARRREELVAIEARHGSRRSMEPEIEVDAAGLDPYGKSFTGDKTTTTTSLDKGRATVDKVRTADKVGADGWTSTRSHDTAVASSNLVARKGEEKTTKVSLTGRTTLDERKSQEIELPDGRTAGVEQATSKEFGPDGASRTQTVNTHGFDGSSTSITRKDSIVRGDGKTTVTTGRGVTETGASGTAVTREGSAGGGIVAGKDGTGAHGSLAGGRKATTKSGMQGRFVGGLHANVVCKVGEPSGDPKLYPVSLTVSFGGSIAGSGGTGKKKGSKATASMEIKGSLEKSMTVTHLLGEAELGVYVKSLEAASKGSKVAATHNEFAVIAAGAKANDWGVARQLWQGISKNSADSLTRPGSSIEESEKKRVGVAVEGSAGGIGAGYGVSETHEASKKMTRRAGGKLDVQGKGAHTKQTSKSVSLSAGVAAVKVGTTHTRQTRFGFAIEIDPQDDPHGRMLDALGKCKKKPDYLAFLAAHPKARMISKTDGKTDAEATETGLSLGGETVLTFGTGQRVDEDTTTDASGKVLGKRVAGKATAGGNLGGFADSREEDAVAEIDGDGNAALTMTRTTKDNYGGRSRDKLARKAAAKLLGKGDVSAAGALAQLSGGDDDDTATQDVSGIRLSNKDLKRLGGVACRSMLAWEGITRRVDEKGDWKKAGIAIAQAKGKPSVVAEELARFVGGDRVERMKTLELFIRGGYRQTAGRAFEFPDSLRDVHEDYDLVTDDKLDEKMNTYANKSGDPAAAEECRRLIAIVDRIRPRIQACDEFDNIATKTEMLQALQQNRAMLAQGVKGYGGGDLHPENDPKLLADEGDRLLKQCNDYATEQRRLTGRMQDQDAYTVSERAAGKRLIKQLEDMHDRWAGDYERLKINYGKRNIPFVDMPIMRPQVELVATFERKFRR